MKYNKNPRAFKAKQAGFYGNAGRGNPRSVWFINVLVRPGAVYSIKVAFSFIEGI